MRISWCRPKGRAGKKYLAGRFQGRAEPGSVWMVQAERGN